MCLAIVLTISGSVYGFVYREELQNTVGRSDLIKNVITQDYSSEPLRKVTRAVNIMQSELQCCGGDDPRDYIDSNWAQSNHENSPIKYAPPSCCKDYLRYEKEMTSCPIYVLNTDSSGEQNLNPGIYTEGCKTALSRFFEKYVIVVAGVVITIGILQLVCIIVTSILIHVLNNLYVPQPDDIVYDMARNQEKSPYPSRGDYYR
ncbi:hypothetical protein C0Q70_04874 [Pomacea canaliculata]|uniref:Tetraspanin n=2 Tax=Pomacea canaliculata TaxID=400727 RepID=A0A2T7PJK4_POMCA|nr:hypothetical protein C0Q70_04874 [Pomacea canaliculata]